MAETKNQQVESDSISENDIDQLLQSYSSQETEGKEEIDSLLRNISREESAINQDDAEENNNLIDEISPSDIRNLLNISLDDISVDDLEAELLQAQNPRDSDDSLFEDQKSNTHLFEKNSQIFAVEKDQDEAKPEPANESNDTGIISQDDIEKLLTGEISVDSKSTEIKSKPETESNDSGVISQDDIEKLLTGEISVDSKSTEIKSKPETESNDSGVISQDDIEKLLAGEIGADDSIPIENKIQGSDEQPQEEERSLFISQNELNLLLEEYDNKTSNTNAKTEKEIMASLPEESGIEDPNNFVSQSDLDMLLAEDSDKKNEDIADPDEGLISQEDIDKLLQGKDDNPEEVEDDTSSLISQQDIDTLLKGAAENDSSDELAETGPVDKDDNESGLVSQEDIDSLLRDATDQDDEENHTEPQIELDRVVLEEADDSKIIPDEPPPPEVKTTERKKWYRSRLVIACSAGAIVLLISSVALYFFLSSDHAGTGKPEIASIESESKKTDPAVEEAIPSGLSIDFNGFVVLDPRNRGDIAYLKADIQINCNSNATVNTIASRKPFFRFLIYDIFQKNLEKLELPEKEKNPPSEKKKEDSSQSENHNVPLLDKTKLQIAIRQSLENALSEKGIKEIILKNIDLF
ncbi:MAG: hypothetical protein C0403_00245 [Desulfobacterium sp.]|nr:hypothetical protein [Desulfobacterium sp.]